MVPEWVEPTSQIGSLGFRSITLPQFEPGDQVQFHLSSYKLFLSLDIVLIAHSPYILYSILTPYPSLYPPNTR